MKKSYFRLRRGLITMPLKGNEEITLRIAFQVYGTLYHHCKGRKWPVELKFSKKLQNIYSLCAAKTVLINRTLKTWNVKIVFSNLKVSISYPNHGPVWKIISVSLKQTAYSNISEIDTEWIELNEHFLN